MEKCDQIKKDQPLKSKNSEKGGGITICVPLCSLIQNETRNCHIMLFQSTQS